MTRELDSEPRQNLKNDPAAEGLAIREHNLLESADRRAALDRDEREGDFITGLERILGPPEVDHVRRIAGLGRPMHHVALFVLRIKFQEAVRIGPKPFRDGS